MAQNQTRMTRQRAVILEELRKTKSHPTADELYGIVRERLPRISLGTVYRNLDFLADSGEIRRLQAAGSTKRFDGDISWHQHVRCLRCGRIGDVRQPLAAPTVEGIKAQGFSSIVGSRIEFDGICDECAGRQDGAR
ncbi:Fur family transcriptional regulator [uncultured Desulfovibrio sp.]|uniref:Fur family transcriptional regulator n=1 Tax=uncultured Desulfovibrio sp. TaxID=167968 RepID=UPI0003A0DEA9|nr:transcriptional repressor [uncultured Desulfovibrio sp.]